MHDGSHIGEVCPDCGTHHRVLETLPAKPLTRSAIESLTEGEIIHYAQGIGWRDPEFLGVDGDDDVTENLVLATDGSVVVVRLYEPGWVVEYEETPAEDEDVEQLGKKIWNQASNDLGYGNQRLL